MAPSDSHTRVRPRAGLPGHVQAWARAGVRVGTGVHVGVRVRAPVRLGVLDGNGRNRKAQEGP